MKQKKFNIGRNERCPCGSGNKYKRCCGKSSLQWSINPDDALIPREFKGMIDQAEAFRKEHQRSNDLNKLDQEIGVLERVVGKPTFPKAELQFRLTTYGRTGLAYWMRFQWLRDPEDLEKSYKYYFLSAKDTKTSSSKYSVRMMDWGKVLEAVFKLGGDERCLVESLKVLREAHKRSDPESTEHLMILNNLGAALLTQYEETSKDAFLDEAITLFEDTWKTAIERNWTEIGFVGLNLASSLWMRFCRDRNRTDLETALQNVRNSLSLLPQKSFQYSEAKQVLGVILVDFYELTGNDVYLDEVITELDDTVLKLPGNHSSRPKILNCLGLAHFRRYALKGNLADLEIAAGFCQSALIEGAKSGRELPGYLNNFSGTLSLLYERTAQIKNLDSGIQIMRDLLDRMPEESPDFGGFATNLGLLMWHRYRAIGSNEDLLNSFSLAKRALELTSQTSPEFLNRCIAMGNVCIARFELEHKIEFLSEGIRFHEEARRLCDPESRQMVGILNNLAWSLSYRSHLTQSDSDRLQISMLYEDACQLGAKFAPEEALRSARNWGNWAFQEKDWKQACKAYAMADKFLNNLLKQQVIRPAKESWLREIQGVTANHTYALAKHGDVQNAVLTFEYGRARLLQDIFARRQITRAIVESGNQQIFDEFVSLTDELDRMQKDLRNLHQSPFGARISKDIKKAEDRLDEIIRTYHKPPFGGDEGKNGSELNDLLSFLTEDEIIVCITVTKLGSVALFVRPNVLDCLFLDFDESGLKSLIIDQHSGKGFLASQLIADDLQNSILEVQNRLGREVMAEISAKLRLLKATNVILIPGGLLNLFPLHSAIYQLNGKALCLLDEFTISISPNIQSVRMGSKTPEVLSYLGIANPLPHPHPLPETELEVKQIGEMFRIAGNSTTELFKETATRDRVMSAAMTANIVHFACHAVFDPVAPNNSRLELADNTQISLRDLTYGLFNIPVARLVILSACQTGLADFRYLPDEIISFPTAFLELGVSGVVASLWPVPTFSSLLLITRFSEILIDNPSKNPAAALRTAQLWLRNLNDGELSKYLEGHAVLNKISHRFVRVPLEDPERIQFAHPYHWAAFVFIGR